MTSRLKHKAMLCSHVFLSLLTARVGFAPNYNRHYLFRNGLISLLKRPVNKDLQCTLLWRWVLLFLCLQEEHCKNRISAFSIHRYLHDQGIVKWDIMPKLVSMQENEWAPLIGQNRNISYNGCNIFQDSFASLLKSTKSMQSQSAILIRSISKRGWTS